MISATLLSLVLPAALATSICQQSATNFTQLSNQTQPLDPNTPTNGTGSVNGTFPEDDTPWVPSCKLPRSYAWLSVGHGFMSDCVPSTGTIQGFMIFVDFSDAEATEDSPQENYDFLVPDANKWFQESSYGQLALNITADTSKFYRMPHSAESYNWDAGLSNQQQYAYVEDALDAYMNNGENPPPAKTDILYIVTSRNNPWFGRSLASSFGAFTRDNTFVSNRAITFGVDPYVWGFKALNHETGHSMCLPDLYPLDSNLAVGEYVGGWDVMGNIGGMASDFFAWDKWRLGWLQDEDVDCILEHGTTRHTLTPVATQGGGTKAIVVATNKTSALVAEARVAKGLDEKICAPGVLLYTIDTSLSTGLGPIRVLDATPGSDSCGSEISGWEPLNDATLTMSGVKSYKVPGWGITVTLVDEKDNEFAVEVEYSKNL
ncbi:hypothetical protein EDB82DRAFT_117621 [Fusarium venenatum]|uniref:uncharacterized protein n=1 Tax=Fusarium venenatum TaxID=56646 RepID=UPI001D76B98B|nr:hypothetical protein EDB82DRAFT_117621 [Fusarium venenatum]